MEASTGHGRPRLSVVIASYESLGTIEECLDSLAAQRTSASFETILVDSSDDGTAALVRRRHPGVKLIDSPGRLFPGDARNRGMEVAGGDVIAFLDADCTVECTWVESVLEAHRGPHLLVGGVVENGTRGSRVAWAYYFCEFSHWLPRRRAREIPEAPGCSLSLKRGAYEAYGPFLEGTYCSDTAFHWRARADGHRVRLEPSIRVFHRLHQGVGEFLRHVAAHRRCFARVKTRERRLGPAGRLGHGLLALLLPILLMPIMGGRVVRSPGLMGEFLKASPLVLAGLLARAWGELIGYVGGVDRG